MQQFWPNSCALDERVQPRIGRSYGHAAILGLLVVDSARSSVDPDSEKMINRPNIGTNIACKYRASSRT